MSLKILMLHDLACCTQLHDGLCHLPCLEFLEVYRAVAIKRVGPEFVQPYSHHHHPSSWVVVAFSRLNRLILNEWWNGKSGSGKRCEIEVYPAWPCFGGAIDMLVLESICIL